MVNDIVITPGLTTKAIWIDEHWIPLVMRGILDLDSDEEHDEENKIEKENRREKLP